MKNFFKLSPIFLLLALLLTNTNGFAQNIYKLASPNGKLKVDNHFL